MVVIQRPTQRCHQLCQRTRITTLITRPREHLTLTLICSQLAIRLLVNQPWSTWLVRHRLRPTQRLIQRLVWRQEHWASQRLMQVWQLPDTHTRSRDLMARRTQRCHQQSLQIQSLIIRQTQVAPIQQFKALQCHIRQLTNRLHWL